jgi:RimJ/RimL family protein N-acetyltransferase
MENGTLDPHAIWVASEGQQVRAAQVCVPLPGASCLAWLPAGDPDCLDLLVGHTLAWAKSIGCKVVQALASPEEAAWTAPLLRQGFVRTTRIRQLEHDLTELPGDDGGVLRFEPYADSLHGEFAAVLARTYEGTLDCPELNGTRTTDDILAGHRGQGRFDPAYWWLVRYEGAPVGVVLLAEMPDRLTWEVSYLGVVPEARRRGFARSMTVRALHALRNSGAARLLLAVDERNLPALALYRRLGFVVVETNDVLLYVVPQS